MKIQTMERIREGSGYIRGCAMVTVSSSNFAAYQPGQVSQDLETSLSYQRMAGIDSYSVIPFSASG